MEAKEARRDIQRLQEEITSLERVLTGIKDLADAQSNNGLAMLDLLNQPEGPMQQCQAVLTDLADKLRQAKGNGKMKQFGMRALKWPFKSKDIDDYLVTIERHKTTFGLALTADNVYVSYTTAISNFLIGLTSGLSRVIKNGIADLSDKVLNLQTEQTTLKADKQRQSIHCWLSAPDPYSNHNAARKKHQASTGAWIVSGDQFSKWKAHPGFRYYDLKNASLLFSQILKQMIFYFDFNDARKQRPEDLLRSLITQLSTQSIKTPEALVKLHSHRQNGPTTDDFSSTLRQMLDNFNQVFFILDALDECTERYELLGLIGDFVEWKAEKLHLLATSRREPGITEVLESLTTCQISIQNHIVDADIQIYVRNRLHTDPKLKKFPANVHLEIEATLMTGAQGM